MNIITRKENILKNNITTSAMSIETDAPFFVNTLTIVITILLEDLKKINYWKIPSMHLKKHIKDFKLICNYVELVKMEILEIPKGNDIIKVARLRYEGEIERQSLYINNNEVTNITWNILNGITLGGNK